MERLEIKEIELYTLRNITHELYQTSELELWPLTKKKKKNTSVA